MVTEKIKKLFKAIGKDPEAREKITRLDAQGKEDEIIGFLAETAEKLGLGLTGKDIREGKLRGLKLLVCPGGGSARQLRAMQKSGIAELKRFIAGGGSYVGACAGCYSVTNRPGRLGLLPFDSIYLLQMKKYCLLLLYLVQMQAESQMFKKPLDICLRML